MAPKGTVTPLFGFAGSPTDGDIGSGRKHGLRHSDAFKVVGHMLQMAAFK